ncbi:ATP phosphoribosyltransferase [uncultured Gemmiger sp.]|uniref:ATP phosphoribosyltransferase n=1 Tax=uncultured Gemmiger sp. TaxID=1623490 RepID=UPI0026664471|nr:ATP phosphoribosyltransferase [uncultured Gemmiger sp.]
MEIQLQNFTPAEQATFRLRALYERAGYRKYRCSRFEEYALYQEYQRFLPDAQVVTFTDLDGKLRAIKPDVTLSIAKTAQPAPGECKRFYYNEEVCRPSRESHTFQTIHQMGLECMGAVDATTQAEVVQLALQSLAALNVPTVLEVSHMGFVTGLLDALQVPEAARGRLLELLNQKNAHELHAAALADGLSEPDADALCGLLALHGPLCATLTAARGACRSQAQRDALEELQALQNRLGEAGRGTQLDLSMADEMEYYNGLVFTGYVAGVPRAVLKGGRYDYLMQRFTAGANAIGFAIYLDELERLTAQNGEAPSEPEKIWLNIALPKGRLGDKAYKLLAEAGYRANEDYNDTRKLVVENPEAGVRYFLVKPSDVAIYVEHGAADIGIVGKDILAESDADVYELLDTGMGKCRMCVAGPKNFTDDESRALRVATKFVNIARDHYERRGRDIDIIKLNGSIELAPILGLSDVIVDIVETGTTLRENDLTVIEEFMPISARFIANKASYKFKYQQMSTLLNKMKEALVP